MFDQPISGLLYVLNGLEGRNMLTFCCYSQQSSSNTLLLPSLSFQLQQLPYCLVW